MSMKFVNRICPNCWSPNYVVLLEDFSKAYKYKCMNCNNYFNDIIEKEPLPFVWKSECINSKIDMVEVVRCKDCEYGYEGLIPGDDYYCYNYDLRHNKEWFCADGKKREKNDNQQREANQST